MEMLKDASCLELRNLLNVWTAVNDNPDTCRQHKEKIRRKVHVICDHLDRIERLETFTGIVP